MAKSGISTTKLKAHITDEKKDRNTYGMEAAAAKMRGDKKVSAVLSNISREEHGHATMLKNLLQRGSMNPAVADNIDFGTQAISAERPLNQGANEDAGARAHAQEALRASLETGLGNENFRSKGGDKSSYSPDSSTGKVLRY